MRGLRFNIPTKFFGLNKSDVDTYFDNLTKKQSKDINDLSEEIDKLYKDKNKLLSELQASKKEEIVYEDEVVGESPLSNEVMDNALKRIEKTIALINMLADEEANQLMEKSYDKLVEYDKIAERLRQEIEENKAKIESLLGDVVKLLKENVDDVTSKIKDKSKVNRSPENVAKTNKNVIELFEGKMIEEKSILEKDGARRTTADGSSLDTIQKLFAFKNKYLSKEEVEENKVQIPKKSTHTKTFDDELDFLNSDIDYSDKFDEYENLYDFENTEEEIPMDDNFSDTSEEINSSDDDIKKMRNALILGKIAGEDLLDSNNNIVIPKGRVLTEEDIIVAERESKLPELIINMTLQQ